MQGQPGRNGCLLNILPTGWRVEEEAENDNKKFVSGERKWQAIGFKVFTSKIKFFYLTFLQTKPANQVCSGMASPGFWRWFPISHGGATHSNHWLTQFFYLFQSNISQHASHPVSFPSAESCPAVYLNVCNITMATNICPQSQHGDWRQS